MRIERVIGWVLAGLTVATFVFCVVCWVIGVWSGTTDSLGKWHADMRWLNTGFILVFAICFPAGGGSVFLLNEYNPIPRPDQKLRADA